MYDKKISKKLKEIFEEDLEYCTEKTLADYNKRTRTIRFKESVSRLLSGIL